MASSNLRITDITGKTFSIGNNEIIDQEGNIKTKQLKTKTLLVRDINRRGTTGVMMNYPIFLNQQSICKAVFDDFLNFDVEDNVPLVMTPDVWTFDAPGAFITPGPQLILNSTAPGSLISIPTSFNEISTQVTGTGWQALVEIDVSLLLFIGIDGGGSEMFMSLQLHKNYYKEEDNSVVEEQSFTILSDFFSPFMFNTVRLNTKVLLNPTDTLDIVLVGDTPSSSKVTVSPFNPFTGTGPVGSVTAKLISLVTANP